MKIAICLILFLIVVIVLVCIGGSVFKTDSSILNMVENTEEKKRYELSPNGKLVILTEEERCDLFDKNDPNSLLHKKIEFRFFNLSSKALKIYYEENVAKPLQYITTIPAESNRYIYLLDPTVIKPGTMLFSKFLEDGDNVTTRSNYAFKPYPVYYMDYNIYFGEISTDFLRDTIIRSDRNEILSLKIINRGLKPYNVWYRGDYLGKVEGYSPEKFEVDYSLLTTANDKHFQLGTWLEFMMDVPNAKKQLIQLRNQSTNIVYVGDVVGRTETNA